LFHSKASFKLTSSESCRDEELGFTVIAHNWLWIEEV